MLGHTLYFFARNALMVLMMADAVPGKAKDIYIDQAKAEFGHERAPEKLIPR